ncbi:MAG TPA: GtrA family protein [Pseudonocardia sp.]|jgi:putative flippase GtrA
MSSMSLPLPTPATIAVRADATGTRRTRRRSRRISRKLVGELVRYAVVGISSTALQLGLYLVLRGTLGPLTANLISLVISNVANTAANRYFTFGVTGSRDAGRHQLQGLLLFFLSLGLTSGALGLLDVVAPGASQTAELVVLVAANTLGTIARFSLMRNWVFTRRR